jgi:hypothetical protein
MPYDKSRYTRVTVDLTDEEFLALEKLAYKLGPCDDEAIAKAAAIRESIREKCQNEGIRAHFRPLPNPDE